MRDSKSVYINVDNRARNTLSNASFRASSASYNEITQQATLSYQHIENPAYNERIPYIDFITLSDEDILIMGLREKSKRLNYNFHAYKLTNSRKDPSLINTGKFFMIPEEFAFSPSEQKLSFPKRKDVYRSAAYFEAVIKEEKDKQANKTNKSVIETDTDEKPYLIFGYNDNLFYADLETEVIRNLLIEYYLKPFAHSFLSNTALYREENLTTTREVYDTVFNSFVENPPQNLDELANRTLSALHHADLLRTDTNDGIEDATNITASCWKFIDSVQQRAEYEADFAAILIKVNAIKNSNRAALLTRLDHVLDAGSIEKGWVRKSDIDKMESKKAQNIATALAVFPDLSIYGTLTLITSYAASHNDKFSIEGMQSMMAIKILLGALFTSYYFFRVYEVHRLHDYNKNHFNDMAFKQEQNQKNISKEAWLLFVQVMVVSIFSGYPLSGNPQKMMDLEFNPQMLVVSALAVAMAIPLVTAIFNKYAYKNEKLKETHYASLALIGLVTGALIYCIPFACDVTGNLDEKVQGLVEGSVLERLVSAIAGLGFYFLSKSTSCATKDPVMMSKTSSPSQKNSKLDLSAYTMAAN